MMDAIIHLLAALYFLGSGAAITIIVWGAWKDLSSPWDEDWSGPR